MIACPKCHQSMFRGKHGGTEVDLCSGCHGLWLDRAELAAILGKPMDLSDNGQATAFKCPRCGQPLQKRAYGGRDDLFVDCCVGCGGVHLDRGELVVIRDLAKRPPTG